MIQQEEAAAAAAGGRALRKRTAAQLNPYSMEQAAYARTLNKNGWEDAVLRLKALEARRQREREEQEERERRDVSAAARASGEADASDAESRRKKDDLGGWLRYSSSSTSSDEGIGSSDLSSIDHSDSDEVLPRQRVRHNKDALFVDEDGDGADDEGNDWDKGMPDDFDWRAPPTRVAPQGSTTTAKPSGSKKARNKKRAGGIKRVQGHGFAVAGSQDPYCASSVVVRLTVTDIPCRRRWPPTSRIKVNQGRQEAPQTAHWPRQCAASSPGGSRASTRSRSAWPPLPAATPVRRRGSP